MKLKTLIMRGLKGAGRTLRLAPVTFFHGPNAAGKSAIQDAVRLAVLGYAPGLPRTVDGVLRLAAGDELDVEAGFEVDGETVTVARGWRRFEIESGSKAGTLKGETTVSVSTCKAEGKKANEAAAADLFGDPVLFDLAGLLDLSDAQRRKLLFRLGGDQVRGAWTQERVRGALGDQARAADGWDPEADDVLEWCAGSYERSRDDLLATRRKIEAERAAERSVREHLEAPDPAVVGAAEKRLAEAERAARDDARARGEAVAAARSRLREAENAACEIGRARETAEGLRRDLAGLRAGVDDAEVQRLAAVLRVQEEGSGGWGAAVRTQGLTALQQAVTGETEALTALQRAAAQARGVAESAVDETALRQAQRQADAVAGLAELAAEAVNAVIAVQNERRGELRAAERAIVDMDAVLEQLKPGGWGQAPECPTCRQPVRSEHLALLRERREALVPARDAAAEALAVATQVVNEAKDEEDTACARRQEADQIVAAVQRSILAEQDRRQQAATEADRAVVRQRDRIALAETAVRERQRAIDDARRALAAAQSATPDAARIATLEERLAAAEAKAERTPPDVEALRAELAATSDRANTADADHTVRVEAIKAELIGLRKVLRDLEQAETHKERRLQLEQDEAAAKACAEAFGPKGLMGEVVRDVLAPFCGAVNAAIGDLDLGEFVVRLADEREHAVFHLGLERADTFAPVETLSGGEQAAVHAGIAAGLASLARARWSVAIVDNVERLDRGRRRAFMVRMVAMQAAGEVDQVLLFGCPDTVDPVEGVTAVVVGS
ncbi:MAG: hypothetical protein ABIL09_29665 [Gemmatimonadota bacterium]